MSSVILYVAIVLIWAAVLIPRWLRRDSPSGEPVAEAAVSGTSVLSSRRTTATRKMAVYLGLVEDEPQHVERYQRHTTATRKMAVYLGLVEDERYRDEYGGEDKCEEGSGRQAKRVMSSAANALQVAARLLPAADRARYAEEYLSELWDLAQSGVGRLGQLRCAICQLYSVVPMVLALRSPRRRSARP